MKSNVSALVLAAAVANAIAMWLSAIIIGGTIGWLLLAFLALWIYPIVRSVEEIERLTERERAQKKLKQLAISEINKLGGDD